MKKCFPLFLTLIITISASSFAQIPQKISYQGLLTTGSGAPVADGNYDLKFEIFNLPGGGTLRHSETHSSVMVQRGTFSLALGPLPAIFIESLYVEVTALAGPGIGSPLTFSPRSELTSAPYALQSVSLLGPNSIASGVGANAGGSNNRALGTYSTVSGGGGDFLSQANSAQGDWSVVAGGDGNTASGNNSAVSGGLNNHATGDAATIGGGGTNTASGGTSTISGGAGNTAAGPFGTIGGGLFNRTSDQSSTVGGGEQNVASGYLATVPGGAGDSASALGAFAAGIFAKARHSHAFVWSDGYDFGSTGVNQFLIHAGGGVGIGTNSPGAALDVLGNVRSGSSSPNALMGTHPSYSNTFAAWWKEGSDYAMLSDGTNTYLNAPLTAGSIYLRSNNSDIMVVQGSTGSVGIGTTEPDQLLSVNGNASKSGGGMWVVFSDRRLKTDINPFHDGLSVIKRVNPVTFRYNGKRGLPTDRTYVGVIAQEMNDVAPYTIDSFKGKLNQDDDEETDILRFDANALTYICINAIKELSAENQELRQELDGLKAMVKSFAAGRHGTGNESMGELK